MHLFYLLNNQIDQLLMTCFLITLKDYWPNQSAPISPLYFLSLPSYKSHLHARFYWDSGKKNPHTIFKIELSISNLLLKHYLHRCFTYLWFLKQNAVSRIISVQRRCSILTAFGFIQNFGYRHSIITHIPFWPHTLH